ncbi:MAG: hypothetical protein WDN44_04175 [Sphingomonas sp.]
MLRTLVTVIGVLAILMGLLWVGQGLGWIHWPASSFMLEKPDWSVRGAILAVVGAIAVAWARWRR